MNIEDRMSLWAAKRPRDEAAELLLEGAQEIADLRRSADASRRECAEMITSLRDRAYSGKAVDRLCEDAASLIERLSS